MAEVMEQEATAGTTGAPATTRKAPPPLTAEQKQAATLRRNATLLRQYGNDKQADELLKQAATLAPEPTSNKRIDPLRQLTAEEQQKLRKHFEVSKSGFEKLAAVVSYNKLAAIAQEIG